MSKLSVFLDKFSAYNCITCGKAITPASDTENVLCDMCRFEIFSSAPKEKDGICSAVSYRNKVGRKLILYLKNHNCIKTINYAAQIVAERLTSEQIGDLSEYYITYAPRSTLSYIKHHFDQSREIAASIAFDANGNTDKCIRMFKRNLFSKQQKFLGRKQRKTNITKNVSLRKSISVPKKLIIIDDVTTTGSTLYHLRDLAISAGAESVILCTLAVSD